MTISNSGELSIHHCLHALVENGITASQMDHTQQQQSDTIDLELMDTDNMTTGSQQMDDESNTEDSSRIVSQKARVSVCSMEKCL